MGNLVNKKKGLHLGKGLQWYRPCVKLGSGPVMKKKREGGVPEGKYFRRKEANVKGERYHHTEYQKTSQCN